MDWPSKQSERIAPRERGNVQQRTTTNDLPEPSFLGAAFVIEHTDLLLTVPRRLGDVLQGRGAFRFLPVPFPLPEYEVKQHWHERYHHDEGNRWLRRCMERV